MPFCPKCGSEVPSNASFCTNCSAPLKGGVETPSSKKLPPSMMELRMNIQRKEETDAVMSFAKWFLISLITLGIAGIYVMYKLIKRRNDHFKRQWRLMESLEDLIKSISKKKDVDITGDLNAMIIARKDSMDNEGEKSAALWVILSWITGIASLYVLYFLTTDIQKHHRRQIRFVKGAVDAMKSLGLTSGTILPITAEQQYEVPKRSFAIYLTLTIITLGVFGIYWSYTIFKDYNEHFKTQWRLEDEILESLRTTPT